jgi:mannitol-1-phosphate/altronate dehydrogenase
MHSLPTLHGESLYEEKRISGIVHIGVGKFHRSHQESYLNDLLKLDFEKYKNWCYTGIGMIPSDKTIQTKLKRNNFRYHLRNMYRYGKNAIDYKILF